MQVLQGPISKDLSLIHIYWPQKSTFGDWEVTKGYDSLGRLTSETMETPEGVGTVKTAYSYLNWESDSTRTTGVLRRIAYTTASGGLSLPQYRYTYDYRGNICLLYTSRCV